MGDFKQCIEVSKKALAVNDSLAGAYYNIGLAYLIRRLKWIRIHCNPANASGDRRTLQECNALSAEVQNDGA